MSRVTVRALLLLASAIVASMAQSALAATALVSQPKPFGYFVGDVLTQWVLLQADGRAFEPAALPRAERISAWFERRTPRVVSTADGSRWLRVDYQIVNAPQALTLIRVPAWELKPRTTGPSLHVAAWPVSVSPLTPDRVYAQGGLARMRPDRAAPSVDTGPLRSRIAIWSGALVATLIAWLAWVWWRDWRAASNLPFAAALREIRGLDDTAAEAWQALHRAFDRTAGRVTQTANLPSLFQRAPYLAPLRPKIEAFFRQSRERFFGAGLPANALSVRALCAELRRLEKAHES